jgi:hypothetical protein
MQRAYLVHVLGALSNLASSPEEQAAFLRNALDGSLVELFYYCFFSLEFYYLKKLILLFNQHFFAIEEKCCGSVEEFLAYAGMLEPAPADPALFKQR